MSVLGLSPFGRLAAIAPLGLRLVLGLVMVVHGYAKIVAGPARFGVALAALGVPAPVVVAYVVTVVEIAGGILLVLGLLSRVAALVLAIEVVFTTVLVKVDVGLISGPRGGPGAEFDLALLAGFLAIVLAGPGPLSLDRVIGLERRRTVDHPRPGLAAIGRSADRLGTVTRVPAAERPAASESAGAEAASGAEGPATAEHPPPTAVEPGPVPRSDEPATELTPAAGPENGAAAEPVAPVEPPEPSEPAVALAPSPAPSPSGAPSPSPSAPVEPPTGGASPAQRLRQRPGLAVAAGVAAGLLIRSALRRR